MIVHAQEEARRLDHNHVGTEMILVGLIREGAGIATRTLKSMGVSLKDAQASVENLIGRGSGVVAVEIPFTKRAKHLLEQSWQEAQDLGHNYIGTEHLLLGLVQADEGPAITMLKQLGIEPAKVRELVLQAIEKAKTDSSSGTPAAQPRLRQRFKEKAIKAIMLAQEESRRLGHNFCGPEQILLGLIGERTGIAARTLESLGINLEDTRHAVEKLIGRGDDFVAVEIPFTNPAKDLFNLCWDEARQLGHSYICTEHLLLALVRVKEGTAITVLEQLGTKPDKVREFTLKAIEEAKGDPSAGSLRT